MHYTPEQFVALAIAFAFAALRLLTASKPFWSATLFAKYATVAGPVLVAALAAVPVALSGAKSWTDVGVALLTIASIGFAAAHGKKDSSPGDSQAVATKDPEPTRIRFEPPSDDPPPAAAIRLWPGIAAFTIVLMLGSAMLSVSGCHGGRINWPKAASCAEPLEQPLLVAVADVLAGTGDVESELAGIAQTQGPGLVLCAVQQLVNDLGTAPVTARASRQAVRGRAFLAKVRAQ